MAVRTLLFLAVLATLTGCEAQEPVVTTADAADAAAADGSVADAVQADTAVADAGDAAGLDADDAGTVDAAETDVGIADSVDAAGPDVDPADTADTAAALPQCASAADCPAQNPCLIGTCTSKGTCAFSPKADATLCDDGNACTTADTCSAGQCAGKGQLACDDENPCTADKCNPIAGCLNLPVAASSACDDGDACTQGDSCQQGQCEAGVNTCQCKNNSDCNKFEDGDQCNGTLYCDKTAGAPYTCKVNPASVVSCPSVNNSACQKNTCVPATGQCKLILSPENTPCDDGDSCTTGDFCDTGLCQGGVNTCYCKKDSDCKAFEDGNLCNGSLFCNKATAQCQVNPVTVVTCQTVDDTQCLRNTCNPKEGKCYLLPLKDGKVCDDGNACTPNEACDKGECQSAVNTCECQKDADCLAKDDGNLCNGTLYCDVQVKKCRVNPVTVVTCNTDDDPACLADVCDPKTGKCKEIGLPKDGTACDDGNLCTALSLCSAGQCVGQANVCSCQKDSDCAAKEDGNLCNGTLFCNPKTSKCEVNPATVVECASGFDENCLTNQCDPKTGGCGMQPAHQGNQCDDGSVCSAGGWCLLGSCEVTVKQACECVQDSDCSKLEDGDLCNGTLYCDKTGGGASGGKPSCKLNPATLITCPTVDNTACSKAICQAKTGKCALTPVSGACEDGKVCTDKDGCLNGQCLGLAKVCSDNLPCTQDSCQEPFGCVYLPGGASACEDGNVCTAHSCDPKQGCVTTPVGGICNDGNPCTLKDVCNNGQCQGGSGGCDDGNPCTQDACSNGVCSSTPLVSGPCSDGNLCTTGDACATGKCVPGKALVCNDGLDCSADSCDPATGKCVVLDISAAICDDKNPCTDEACYPVVGCTHLNTAKQCNDGNPCTTGDACKNGSCSTGSPTSCNDGNPCTDDSCDAKKGGCITANNSLACNDGVGCTQSDACKGGQCVGILLCDDKDPCTLDKCDLQSGKCVAAPSDGPCDDGNSCTIGELCSGGVCGFATLKSCDDGNACTDDACDKLKGCYSYPNQASCSTKGCTLDDACEAGVCKAGPTQALGPLITGPGPGSTPKVHIRGVHVASDHMVVYGGLNQVTVNSPSVAWVARGTMAGQWQWQQHNFTVPVDSIKVATHGYPNSLGGLDVFLQTSGSRPTMARLDGKGNIVKIINQELKGFTAYTHDVVYRPASNDYLTVGSRTQPGKAVDWGWLAVFSAVDLSFGQTAVVDEFQGGAWLYAVTLAHDGKSVVAVGKTPKPGYAYDYEPLLMIQGADLSPATRTFTALPQGPAADHRFRAVTKVPGGYLATGTVYNTVSSYQYEDILLARFDLAGGLLWSKKLQMGSGSHETGTALLGLADGTALLGGQYNPQAATSAPDDLLLMRLDALGQPLTTRTFASQGNDYFYSLQQTGPGRVVATGAWHDGTNQRGWLLRTTPFLHETCASAGVCQDVGFANCGTSLVNGCSAATCAPLNGACSLAFTTGALCTDGDACTVGDTCDAASKTCLAKPMLCDDKNPCTGETCDKAVGCVYNILPNGTQCGGGKTCLSGVCK